MSGSTISTQVTVGVTLGVGSNPTFASPLTITAAGAITSPGNGVYADGNGGTEITVAGGAEPGLATMHYGCQIAGFPAVAKS